MQVRFRAGLAHLDGNPGDGDPLRLCRLRYGGSASRWRFAIHRASHDDYQDSILPTGALARTPEAALDSACGLYLNDPTSSPTN